MAPTRVMLFCLVGLAACGVLFPNASTEPTTGQASPTDASAAQDRELADRLQALDREIDAQGVTADRAIAYAQLVFQAQDNGAIGRGTVHGPTVVRAGVEHAAAARTAEPQRATSLLLAEGRLELIRRRPERTLALYVEAVEADPRPDPFWALASLRGQEGQAVAVAAACPKVRPQVAEGELPDFVDACLAAAGGDAKSLSWSSAKADLKAHEVEMKRREEEERRREEEERRRREEEARLAAETAQKSQRYAAAAVFAAGRCEFGDCVGNGWTTRGDDGEIRTRCSFGKCLENGWETTFPDGSRATTRCSFGKCLENGWETNFPDGSRATTRCSFGKCASDGWETGLPDGSSSSTRCKFSKCFENGWDTRLPDGGSVSCTCSFSDCLGKGAECQ